MNRSMLGLTRATWTDSKTYGAAMRANRLQVTRVFLSEIKISDVQHDVIEDLFSKAEEEGSAVCEAFHAGTCPNLHPLRAMAIANMKPSAVSEGVFFFAFSSAFARCINYTVTAQCQRPLRLLRGELHQS